MTYVYMIIFVIVLGFAYLMINSAKIISRMENYSKKAISEAREKHNIDLDLSLESLKTTNELIQKLHSSGTFDKEETPMLYGAYIGEVIRNQVAKGFWVKDHPDNGRNTYPVKFSKDLYAFPVIWVRKHLENGEQDNVLHKFNAFKNAHDLVRQA